MRHNYLKEEYLNPIFGDQKERQTTVAEKKRTKTFPGHHVYDDGELTAKDTTMTAYSTKESSDGTVPYI